MCAPILAKASRKQDDSGDPKLSEQMGQPFDYLLFASITSGTTCNNDKFQRDYLLTLETVNIQTGEPDKESATIRKAYTKSCFRRG